MSLIYDTELTPEYLIGVIIGFSEKIYECFAFYSISFLYSPFLLLFLKRNLIFYIFLSSLFIIYIKIFNIYYNSQEKSEAYRKIICSL